MHNVPLKAKIQSIKRKRKTRKANTHTHAHAHAQAYTSTNQEHARLSIYTWNICKVSNRPDFSSSQDKKKLDEIPL